MSSRGLVLISDIHFNVNNLREASRSLEKAYDLARRLDYSLVIAGDLNDTKAIIRAEVANSLLSILGNGSVDVKILVGNHDLINEKGKDHSLNFLEALQRVHVIEKVEQDLGVYFMPYQTSQDAFKEAVAKIPKGSTIICHQGFLGASMGEYVIDKSSIDPEVVKDYTVYSGHYHKHQRVGTVTYIGTPYTTSFAEANDGSKGFLVIDENVRMKQVPTGLRKHVIVSRDYTNINTVEHGISTNDILWLKVSGSMDWLKTLNKEELGRQYIGHSNYRLDLIPTDNLGIIENKPDSTPNDLLDQAINTYATSESSKAKLQSLVKELLS